MHHRPQAWQKAYQEEGFVVVPDLLEPVVLARLCAAMDEVTTNVSRLPARLKEKIFLERDHVKNNPQWYGGTLTPDDCGGAIRQIADLGLFGPAFAQLIYYPPVLDVLEALFASPEFSFSFMVGRPKAARVGNGISNGNFHRDAPFEDYTSGTVIVVLLCLDAMTGENGATSFLRGSHRVSDAEAANPRWRDVPAEDLDLAERVAVCCPAGSGVFFTSKVLHAAGHNRSASPRRSILSEWVGPGVLPISPVRYSYSGLKPRSKDPDYQKQVRMTFAPSSAG
jgi:ectoine hydroxylase-related dioxygenase (phytanoyl-CoA dioxygenase family)